MASENTDNNPGNGVEAAQSSEHDYAHNSSDASSLSGGVPTQGGFSAPAGPAQSSAGHPALSGELREPAVGAEVDCSGGKTAAATASPGVSRGGRRRAMRPEDRSCSCCKTEFERQGRCFNRRAVYTFTTPETVHWAFPGTTVNDKSFLCETCVQVIRSKCKRKQSGKRALWLKPPAQKPTEVRNRRKKGRKMGKKSQAAQLVSKSCYKAAFKMLWSAKGARKPMMEFWSKQLKEEMKTLTRQTDNPFNQKVSSKKPLSSFPWRRCLNWAQDKAPLVTACLTSMFPDINHLSKSSHLLSEDQAQTLLERRAVVALSIPLFTRNIWKNNFLQAALGAELRLQGCSGAALDALNMMGLCQNKDTVRLLLHRLRKSKKNPSQNGQQRQLTDMEEGELDMEMVEEEEEEEEEEEDEEEEEEQEEEEEDDEEEDEEEEIELATVEEEEVEMQDGVQEEDEEEDQAGEEKAEMEKKRRKKKAKKQRKEEKRKERGKRKLKETGQEEEEEEVDDDEGLEEKKKRVVVVRLGLLKGHSEVGRSDLSAP